MERQKVKSIEERVTETVEAGIDLDMTLFDILKEVRAITTDRLRHALYHVMREITFLHESGNQKATEFMKKYNASNPTYPFKIPEIK